MKTVKRIQHFENSPLAFLFADILIVFIILIIGFSFSRFLVISNLDFIAESPIDTSITSLPGYAMLSLTRSLIALSISFVFAILYGTFAASKPSREKVMIPILDVLQSLPVVSFMPGLIFGLTMLFPGSRWGLEIACILMIFTGQVWNLIFAYYESQCIVPEELRDLAKISGLNPIQRFLLLDLPNGIRPLVYNGMMSMAGGWFFLTLCEAFPLGGTNFRLPGLGSYMHLAYENGQTTNFICGLLVMMVLIIGVDFLLWKPLIAWSARFRDHQADGEVETSVFLNILERSRITLYLSKFGESMWPKHPSDDEPTISKTTIFTDSLKNAANKTIQKLPLKHWNWQTFKGTNSRPSNWKIPIWTWVASFGSGAMVFWLLPKLPHLSMAMSSISQRDWLQLINSLIHTAIRVFAVLILSTLWVVPVGVIIGKSVKVAKYAQPIVQNIAAFPAPMLFPLLASYMSGKGMSPNLIAIILMLIGNQWYLFFNVISGASRIPEELKLVAKVYRFPLYKRITNLYLPAIFPSMVTGWITAAGGAWNTSIVAELVVFPTGEMRAQGIGSELKQAVANGDMLHLSAAVCVIVIALIVLNRSLWRTLHIYAERLKAS